MKGLVDREKLNEILEPVENLTLCDIETGTGTKVEFKNGDTLKVSIGKKEYNIIQEAFTDASRSVGIPAPYVKKCPTSLIISQLNYWYNCDKLPPMRFLIKEDKVVGITSKQVPIVSTGELLEEVEKVVGKDHILGYHKPVVSLDFTKVPVVCDYSADIVVNDKFFGGVYLQNSALGTKSLEIASYVVREICVNGAISIQNLLKWSRRNVSYSALTWAKDSAESAFAGLRGEFERVKRLVDVKIDRHVSEAVRSIFADFSVPAKLQDEIMDELANIGASSLYDVYNAVTKIGTHSERVDENPYEGRRLQLVGSQITQHPDICVSCHRILD